MQYLIGAVIGMLVGLAIGAAVGRKLLMHKLLSRSSAPKGPWWWD